MTVEQLRVFINACVNRDQTGNAMKPDEYNSYLARAVEDKFRIETGLRELRTPIYFQNNQLSTDALKPFLAKPIITGVSGIFAIPVDYAHTISMTSIVNGKTRITTTLNADQFEEKKQDPNSPPTELYPYATEIAGNIEIAPDTVDTIKFVYLKKPVDPFWNWTVVNDEEVYNPIGSIQIPFDAIYHIDIARIIMSYIGINFRDAEFLQYAESLKQKGA